MRGRFFVFGAGLKGRILSIRRRKYGRIVSNLSKLMGFNRDYFQSTAIFSIKCPKITDWKIFPEGVLLSLHKYRSICRQFGPGGLDRRLQKKNNLGNDTMKKFSVLMAATVLASVMATSLMDWLGYAILTGIAIGRIPA